MKSEGCKIKNKITKDIIINIIAFGIPIVLLQVIVLPIIGARLGETEYGKAITLISFSTLFSVPFGSVLNNIRLLEHKKYDEQEYNGDFNIILFINIILNIIIILLGGHYYKETPMSIFLIGIFSSFNILREYLLVSFRIKLNFNKILINNIFLAMGYLIGLVLFFISGYWQFIYIVGNGISVLYITYNSSLLNENFSKTPLFYNTSVQSIKLFIAMLLNTALNYIDKLLLYPMLGSSAVAIYYSATLIGKLVSLLISPLSNVILSHVVRINKLSNKYFFKIVTYLIIFGIGSYFFTVLISEPIMKIIYPNWFFESLKLVPITNATAIIVAINSVINTLILRYKNLSWQVNINLMTLIVYLVSTWLMYNYWDLFGFSIGVLISNSFKLLITIFVFLYGKDV